MLDSLQSFVQECDNCHIQFRIMYYVDGTYNYIDEPCECESEFHPVDGPSLTQWMEYKNQ